MESHILNTYHQAGYRTIGLHRSSESQSSEGSFQSPEYSQSNRYKDTNEDVWRDSSQEWSRRKDTNTIPDPNSSSDEEADGKFEDKIDEDAIVESLEFEVSANETVSQNTATSVTSTTGNEATDDYNFNYDIIHVYAVDPNLDCASSDDEEEFAIKTISKVATRNFKDKTERAFKNVDGNNLNTDTFSSSVKNLNSIQRSRDNEVFQIKIDTPTELPLEIFSESPVSNVDYSMKEDDDNILAVKDEPVVQDVDEYFIKQEKPEDKSENDSIDFETKFDINPVNIDDFFVIHNNHKQPEPIVSSIVNNVASVANPVDVPSIQDLKEYFVEELSYTRPNMQKSCSLPQSPMHISLDIDAKTCMSFEDLDIDLSDLTFDSDKTKSGNSTKTDEIRTLTEEDVNSFLINTSKPVQAPRNEDDLNQQDMEIERPVQNAVNIVSDLVTVPKTISNVIQKPKTKVLEFCIEKSPVKKIVNPSSVKKLDPDDFVDVESCNDIVIPVLQANNVSALLEQFEATEKLNTKTKKTVIKIDEPKVKTVSLVNGTRLQEAGVQLNKNKMRQIMMPSTVNTTVKRSPSPLHSDHDYCSSKKRHSLPNIRKGQSLLKPEVLSSNSKILNSRHRACKSKKVVYHELSDDESDKCNKTKVSEDSEKNKKPSVKMIKVLPNSVRKKLSPVHGEFKDNTEFKDKSNDTVMVKDACKASDTPLSQNSNGSIKLTIKNKSEVILNCDVKDSQKDKNIEKAKSISVVSKIVVKSEVKDSVKCIKIKSEKDVDRDSLKSSIDKSTNLNIKEEPRPKIENFYTGLFSNKQDVKIPLVINIKKEKLSFEEQLNLVANKTEQEQPQKKKKLNLQEYKLRRGVNSNSSSAQVSPESIFPEMPNLNLDKTKVISTKQLPNGTANATEQTIVEPQKKIFDPIREASRKILMQSKKQKALRKRDEDIVMSKIPKVENLELQPLISEAEMMKMVGIVPPEILPIPVIEKPPVSTDYVETVMVSIGVNTDDTILKELANLERSRKSLSPVDAKSYINFKIKKPEVLKQNVFDVKKDRKSPAEEKKHSEIKIDKERLKDITATLKTVEKQVDTKISSNSLLASIQDIVLKKAPEEIEENSSSSKTKPSKSNSPKLDSFKRVRTAIVRDYDTKAEHGEDKVILHLEKDRRKPESSAIIIQTEAHPDFVDLKAKPAIVAKVKSPLRKRTERTESDMSLSSDSSSEHVKETIQKPEKELKRSHSKEKWLTSKDRNERRRSRSPVRKRRRSSSRSKSRSWDNYKRHRRSDSPYRRKRRSRSPYRPRSRRSPSSRRDYRSKNETRSKSPLSKKSKSPAYNRKPHESVSPPIRTTTRTDSESSDTSTSSSSSSSSEDSRRSRRSYTPPYRRDDFRKKVYRSSEDREANTPVEERRIVFVGKLEKDITKNKLRSQFTKFGPILEVRLHSKEDGSRYGFVTFNRARDAWTAVGAAAQFPRYDVGFGGRRAFCRQTYADLDGLEAKYTESAFHGLLKLPPRREDDMSFEDMLLEMKKKLSQRKNTQEDDKKNAQEDSKNKLDGIKNKQEDGKGKLDNNKNRQEASKLKDGINNKQEDCKIKLDGNKTKQEHGKVKLDNNKNRQEDSKLKDVNKNKQEYSKGKLDAIKNRQEYDKVKDANKNRQEDGRGKVDTIKNRQEYDKVKDANKNRHEDGKVKIDAIKNRQEYGKRNRQGDGKKKEVEKP